MMTIINATIVYAGNLEKEYSGTLMTKIKRMITM